MDRADDLFQRALSKLGRKDYQVAIADFTKAIDLKPDFSEAYHNRARAKTSIADYQGSIADLTKTINLNGDDAESYFDRGIAYLGLGQKSKAIEGFERAKKLGYRVPQEALDMCK